MVTCDSVVILQIVVETNCLVLGCFGCSQVFQDFPSKLGWLNDSGDNLRVACCLVQCYKSSECMTRGEMELKT